MPPAARCPHCQQVRPLDARKTWFIHGFLIFCRWGSRNHVGCAPCVQKKVLTSLVITGLLGWWCFPWGLGTPIALLQNLVALAGGPDPELMRQIGASDPS